MWLEVWLGVWPHFDARVKSHPVRKLSVDKVSLKYLSICIKTRKLFRTKVFSRRGPSISKFTPIKNGCKKLIGTEGYRPLARSSSGTS